MYVRVRVRVRVCVCVYFTGKNILLIQCMYAKVYPQLEHGSNRQRYTSCLTLSAHKP